MTTGPEKTPSPVELAGRLRKAVVAPGSKSEREAVVLDADDGRVLPVRRRGGPAFGADDSGPGVELADLAAWSAASGGRVVVAGSVVAGTLLADAWRSLDEPDPVD